MFDYLSRIRRNTNEITQHLHGWDRMFGAAAAPAGETHVADFEGPTSFVVTSGNDTWGTALQILGSTDTPVVVGKSEYDASTLHFSGVNTINQEYYFRLIAGTSAAAGIAAKTYSNLTLKTATGLFPAVPVITRMDDVDAGTKLWVQCYTPGANGKTATFKFSLHEYD